ncbi:CaiB/BaiF CoA transferase family protein [Halobellus rarus]|uniref:CaiB/BaiF CoA transferase family protein n=1 Tax=Halobellus rarus TaxID=1126237 RepID=A0ABD6CTP0_9EURY
MTPLEDIKVIDFTHAFAGPLCTQVLAAMGADVVKIEPPNGEEGRTFLKGTGFASFNMGKKSIGVDLKTSQGKGVIHNLVKDADVVVENFRPGKASDLDIDFETLSDLNETIVYCSISGFGQEGPYSSYPAFDPMIQAMSGIMDATGYPDRPPVRIGTSAIDCGTGMTAACSIIAAILSRERTGEGEYIDVSLYDVGISWMANWISYYSDQGETPKRSGTTMYGSSPNGLFQVGEGDEYVYVAAHFQPQFEKLCEAIDREDLIEDDRFSTGEVRWDNREKLQEELEQSFEKYSTRQLVYELAENGVPAGPVQDVAEIIEEDPQVESRNMLTDTYNPFSESTVKTSSLPFRTKGGLVELSNPPEFGEHVRPILVEHGFSDDEIDELLNEEILHKE